MLKYLALISVLICINGKASAQEGESLFEKPLESGDTTQVTEPVLLPNSSITPPPVRPAIPNESDNSAVNPFESNRIDTLHYRVPRKSFNLDVSAASPISSTTTETRAGGPLYDHSYSSFSGTISLSYGISDRLLISIGENYLFNQMDTVTYDPNGTVTKYQFRGPSNPSFHLNYRFLGSLNGYAFSSAFIDYSPNTGNSIAASSAGAGNHLSGYNSADIGFNLYWVDHTHEWFGVAYVLYQANGTVDTATVSGYETFNSAVRFESDFGYRYHFLKNFFASASLNFESGYTLSYTYPTLSPVFTEDVDNSLTTIELIDLGWRMSEKTLVRISYSYQSSSADITPTSTAQTALVETKSQRQYLTIGGMVEF